MCRNTNNPIFPCRHCVKNVHDKDKAVQCDLCENWIHIKCNNLNYLDYKYLQTCNQPWYCIECRSKIFPFNSLSCDKNFLACYTKTDSSIMQWKEQKTSGITSLLLKPTPNLELSVNQFSNATSENNNDPENISSSKYYDIDEMHNIGIPNKNKSLSLFHIDPCSLNKIFDDLQYLLSHIKNNVDIIGVTETRITKQLFFIK